MIHLLPKRAYLPLFRSLAAEALRVIEDFDDLSQESRFALTTGAFCFAKFRDCLSSIARDEWDMAKEGKELTEEGFLVMLRGFTRKGFSHLFSRVFFSRVFILRCKVSLIFFFSRVFSFLWLTMLDQCC
jgi:hypothetical protein